MRWPWLFAFLMFCWGCVFGAAVAVLVCVYGA